MPSSSAKENERELTSSRMVPMQLMVVTYRDANRHSRTSGSMISVFPSRPKGSVSLVYCRSSVIVVSLVASLSTGHFASPCARRKDPNEQDVNTDTIVVQ